MKKLLLFLLSLLMVLTSFCACNNDKTDNSSIENLSSEIENSKENSTENSSTIESSEETSQEASEEPEPFISEIPENAVYYTSRYNGDNWYSSEPIFNNKNFREAYSQKNNEGLSEYFKNNDVSDDTYFLVGMTVCNEHVEYEYFSTLKENVGRELIRGILEPYDFIEWENHRMLFDQNYYDEITALDMKYNSEDFSGDMRQRYYDVYGIVKKYMNKRFPDMEYPSLTENPLKIPEDEDMFYYYYGVVVSYRFDVIGYISAKDLKQLDNDLKNGEQVVCITWFPAPDDQERWLTASVGVTIG